MEKIITFIVALLVLLFAAFSFFFGILHNQPPIEKSNSEIGTSKEVKTEDKNVEGDTTKSKDIKGKTTKSSNEHKKTDSSTIYVEIDSLAIFVECNKKGNENYSTVVCNDILSYIKGELSKNGWNIKNYDEGKKAAYKLTLTVSAIPRSNGTGINRIVSYYATVDVSLYNLLNNKTVYFYSINDSNLYSEESTQQIKKYLLPPLKEKILSEVLPNIN
ncbi:MAG: hypothetical protein FWD66_01260 [Paludibacter sp.]|nr:hypothetical protein [Paludibacter sp.]